MHTTLKNQSPTEKYIKLFHFANGKKNVTTGAYAYSDEIKITLEVSRRIGVTEVVLSLYRDSDGVTAELPFEYDGTKNATDAFSIRFFPKEHCTASGGLFYYTVRFKTADGDKYLSSVNNVDFVVTSDGCNLRKFRLLVYPDTSSTPDWAKNAVMYHIFVDRFAKAERMIPPRPDAVYNDDWDNGIPQFAPFQGAELANNEFFGGTLYGVAEKLDYLASLGVNCIYLSPIFKAYSNHKYDTGDYLTVDEAFGGREAFDNLIYEAKRRNIRIILDGVFNHTGNDSLYFNAYGKYPSVGAYQSELSPYHDWFFFNSFPDDYECWWGIKILPKLNTGISETQEFFIGDDGVVPKYLRDGISGWRLDVADELPSEFLTRLRATAKKADPDALIIGEVWENAADKIAYGKRRSYFSGLQLDSVMNYPLKNAVVSFMKTADCTELYNTVCDIYSSYPEHNASVLMNILGTHDTERILTVLGADDADFNLTNAEKAVYRLSDTQRERAVKLLKIASTIIYTMPGMPCIFYGDEAGLEGFGDPFCRRPYPWGREDDRLRRHYATLGKLKHEKKALSSAKIEFITASGGLFSYSRVCDENRISVYVNMTADTVKITKNDGESKIFGECFDETNAFVLPSESVIVTECGESY